MKKLILLKLSFLITFLSNSQTNQWTWVSGDNSINNAGVYGTKGLAAASNKPGGRYGSISWKGSGGDLWLFGGSGTLVPFDSYYLNDLWKYDINTGLWTWVSGDNITGSNGVYGTMGLPANSNKPGARLYSVSWIDASGNLWLFGGEGYDISVNDWGIMNDLWTYNITTGQWTWISGDNAFNVYGVYGTKGIANSSNKPGAREGSMTWTDAAGNLWLFGGSGLDCGCDFGQSPYSLNDLWKYDIAINQWTWVSGDQTYNSRGVYGVKGMPAAANKPGARSGSSTWTDASGNLWLFGGFGFGNSGDDYYYGELNDLWKYNIATNQWTWVSGDSTIHSYGIYGIKGTSAIANKPGGRYGAANWIDASGNLWLFGGGGYGASTANRLNDLWVYNINTGVWTWVSGDNEADNYGSYGIKGVASISNKPGAKGGPVNWIDASGNLWLFGGAGNAASGSDGLLNDLWKFSIITALPVTFLNFNGELKNNQVVLNWSTADEINNKGFDVERSEDGKDFLKIGFVEAKGITTSILHYTFTDINFTGAVNFYRLKQIDIGGNFEYSRIIKINNPKANTYTTVVAPNPFSNVTTISFSLPQSAKVSLKIFDLNGRLVSTLANEEMQAGNHSIKWDINGVDGKEMPSGMYLLKMEAGQYSATRKLIVTK
jgi:hypothetical protein